LINASVIKVKRREKRKRGEKDKKPVRRSSLSPCICIASLYDFSNPVSEKREKRRGTSPHRSPASPSRLRESYLGPNPRRTRIYFFSKERKKKKKGEKRSGQVAERKLRSMHDGWVWPD